MARRGPRRPRGRRAHGGARQPRGDRPARGRLRLARLCHRARQRLPRPRQALPRRSPDPRRSPRAASAPPRMISPVRWDGERLVLLDQTRLPTEEVDRACATWQEVAQAIKTLVVRGAPAIGVAAAFGVALAARQSAAPDGAALVADLEVASAGLGATRPTAV